MYMRPDQEKQLADMIGVPEFFMTTVVTEAAGGGCVRVYNCIERSGLLIPQCTVVMPATALIIAAKKVQAAAAEIFQTEVLAGMITH